MGGGRRTKARPGRGSSPPGTVFVQELLRVQRESEWTGPAAGAPNLIAPAIYLGDSPPCRHPRLRHPATRSPREAGAHGVRLTTSCETETWSLPPCWPHGRPTRVSPRASHAEMGTPRGSRVLGSPVSSGGPRYLRGVPRFQSGVPGHHGRRNWCCCVFNFNRMMILDTD